MKETKWISEFEYVTFKQNLRGILIKTLVGFLVGFLGIIFVEKEDLGSPFLNILGCTMVVLMCAGMPYTWTLIRLDGCLGLVIRFGLSLWLGWIITPIFLTYNFVQMKRYEKNVDYFVQKEENERQEDINRENDNTNRIIKAIEKLGDKL